MALFPAAGNDGASLTAEYFARGRKVMEEGGMTMDYAYRTSYTTMCAENEPRELMAEQHKECLAELEKVKARLSDIYRKLRAHEFDPDGPDEEFIVVMKTEQTMLYHRNVELQDRLDELSERLKVLNTQHELRVGCLKLLYSACSSHIRNGKGQEKGLEG
jgi:hypothetical protein